MPFVSTSAIFFNPGSHPAPSNIHFQTDQMGSVTVVMVSLIPLVLVIALCMALACVTAVRIDTKDTRRTPRVDSSCT